MPFIGAYFPALGRPSTPPAAPQLRADWPPAVPGPASLTSGRGQRGPALLKQTARPGLGAAMTQGPETGREAESFVRMTSPGREGGRGPAPGKEGLAGGQAWGRAGRGAAGGSRGSWGGRRQPPPPASNPEPRTPAPGPRSRVRQREAGSTRLRRRGAPQRSGGSRIHPAASLHFNYRGINIHEPGLEGDRGLSFPSPAHPPHPAPLFPG